MDHRMTAAELAPPDVASESADLAVQEKSDLEVCERMLQVLDAQLADLDKARATILQLRDGWSARLSTLAEGGPPAASLLRAPRGAIRYTLIRELRLAPDGLTIDQLATRIGSDIAHFNRRSVGLALSRLKSEGLVEFRDPCWYFVGPNQAPID